MKYLAYIFRLLCQLFGLYVLFYVIDYGYQNPSDSLGIHIRLLLIPLAMSMFPPRSYNRYCNKTFTDNHGTFEEYGHHLKQIYKESHPVTYHSRNASTSENSIEHRMATVLLNYVVEKGYTDDAPDVLIQRNLWGRGIKVTIRCTWYRKMVYYWIPEKDKSRFELLRFNAAIELADNWYITV